MAVCPETKTDVIIGNQAPQEARCARKPHVGGYHQDILLDSDDNPVLYRWFTETVSETIARAAS